MEHIFSCSKIGTNKLHPFSKISADVFSLLSFKVSLSWPIFWISSWRRSYVVGVDVSLLWIRWSWVQEISWSSSHGPLHRRLTTSRLLGCFSLSLPCAPTEQECDLCQSALVQIPWSCVHECNKKNFLEQSYIPSLLGLAMEYVVQSGVSSRCAFGQKACMSWRMVESRICTNRFRIHVCNVSIHSWSFEITSDGDVLLRGYAVKWDVAPSSTIKNPRVLSSIFADPWSRKMRSLKSSARSPLTWDLSGLGFD